MASSDEDRMNRQRADRIVVSTTIPVSLWTFRRELVKDLVARSHDVLLVTSPGELLNRTRDFTGARLAAIPMARSISPYADIRGLTLWIRLLRRERPAVVMAGTPKAGLLGMIAAFLTGVPRRIYGLHGLRLEGSHGIQKAVLWAMERVAFACATEVYAVSPSLRSRALSLRLGHSHKINVIGAGTSHGVNTQYFAPCHPDPELARRLGIQSGTPVVGLVGRMTADKGIGSFCVALQLLKDQDVSVQVLVLGPQDEPDSVRFTRLLMMSRHRIVFAGSAYDIRPYYALMDILCLPTRREGFPNVVLEASSMAVPSVTTRATGAVDSVLPGITGLIVDVDAPDQLAAAIASVVGDRTRCTQMGSSARKWVKDTFEEGAVVAQIVERVTRPGFQRGVPSSR